MSKDDLQQDSYFTLLQSELAKERASGPTLTTRFMRIATLLALHTDDKKGGFEAWKAVLIAGRLGLVAPVWAIDLLEKVEHQAIEGVDAKGNKRSIGILLGFEGKGKGGGKTSPVQVSLQAQQREILCYSVRLLVDTGESIKSACRIVAKKFQALPLDETSYPLGRPKPESLAKAYREWEKERGEEVLSFYDQGFVAVPRDIKEKMRHKFIS